MVAILKAAIICGGFVLAFILGYHCADLWHGDLLVMRDKNGGCVAFDADAGANVALFHTRADGRCHLSDGLP